MPSRRRIDPVEGVAAVGAWSAARRAALDAGVDAVAGRGVDAGVDGGVDAGVDAGAAAAVDASDGPAPRAAGAALPRAVVATAVRWALEEIAARYPGFTCEVRVPPFGVVQCLPGPRHTRGTPPNVVETDADTWLGLVTGELVWQDAVSSGRLRASGERADLSLLLPLD